MAEQTLKATESYSDDVKLIKQKTPKISQEEDIVDQTPFERLNDPVRMYLREMGSVSLLTREEEVDIAKTMDVLRQMQMESGETAALPKVPVFHKAFLDTVRKRGRVHELTMMQNYSLRSGDFKDKLKTGDWKNDVKLGMKMFLRGKLKIIPAKCEGFQEVRKIFEQAEEHKKT